MASSCFSLSNMTVIPNKDYLIMELLFFILSAMTSRLQTTTSVMVIFIFLLFSMVIPCKQFIFIMEIRIFVAHAIVPSKTVLKNLSV